MSDQWWRNDHEERRDRGTKRPRRQKWVTKKKGFIYFTWSDCLPSFHPSFHPFIHPSKYTLNPFPPAPSPPSLFHCRLAFPILPTASLMTWGPSPLHLPGAAILEQLMDSWEAAVTTFYCLYNTIGCSRAEAHHSLRWKEKKKKVRPNSHNAPYYSVEFDWQP